jgi:hypothetical protein
MRDNKPGWIGRALPVMLFIGVVVLVGLAFSWWVFSGVEQVARIRWGASRALTIEQLGQTGDLFGGLSAFFAALAFIGVAVASFLQRRSVALLAKQLDDSWTATAKAQQDARDALTQSEQQLEQARIHAEMQLRAYVHVSGATWQRGQDGKMWATLLVQNFGQTPAYEMVQWVCLQNDVDQGGAPNFGELPDQTAPSRSILGPGSSTELLLATPGQLTRERESHIKEGRVTYFIHGAISYLDVFGAQRITRFRMLSTGQLAAQFKFTACPDGNDAT